MTPWIATNLKVYQRLSAKVGCPRMLATARQPTRRDAVWEIEFAPFTRMESWKVPRINVGDMISGLGFMLVSEKGDAVLRAECLIAGGNAEGMRSALA